MRFDRDPKNFIKNSMFNFLKCTLCLIIAMIVLSLQTLEARHCRKHHARSSKPYVESEFTVRVLGTNASHPRHDCCSYERAFRSVYLSRQPEGPLVILPLRPIAVQPVVLYPVVPQREYYRYYSFFGFGSHSRG